MRDAGLTLAQLQGRRVSKERMRVSAWFVSDRDRTAAWRCAAHGSVTRLRWPPWPEEGGRCPGPVAPGRSGSPS